MPTKPQVGDHVLVHASHRLVNLRSLHPPTTTSYDALVQSVTETHAECVYTEGPYSGCRVSLAIA